MKRVLCFLLIGILACPPTGWGEEQVAVDSGSEDPVGDVLFFPFRVLGEVFSTTGYEYDPDRQYAWYPDNYYYRDYYWNDPWYYDRYDYYRSYRYGPRFGYYYPWYYHGGYNRHHHRSYRHHGGGHHRDGGRHHKSRSK